MKNIFSALGIILLVGLLCGCFPDFHYLGHAERPPKRYNYDYISVNDFFKNIGEIAHGDTVMLWGWRKNWCDLKFDVLQYGNYTNYIPLILSGNPNDTVSGVSASSAGCVNISIWNVDTLDYLENCRTTDIWRVTVVIHFEMCGPEEGAFGDCYNEYNTIHTR